MKAIRDFSSGVKMFWVTTIILLVASFVALKYSKKKVDPRSRYYRYRIVIPAGQETFVKLCDRETGNEVLIVTERDTKGITSTNTGYNDYCKNVTDEQVKNRWEEARLN